MVLLFTSPNGLLGLTILSTWWKFSEITPDRTDPGCPTQNGSHEPIEILDGRDGEKLREWLRENKHIKKVTRDRAGTYAKAISDILLEAIQIADRFHLHQNLFMAVKEAFKSVLPDKILIPNNTTNNEDYISPEQEKTAADEIIITGDDKKN